MIYLKKEELEDITRELMENPTRETLKNLNNKYNGIGESHNLSTEVSTGETQVVETNPMIYQQNSEIASNITEPSIVQPLEVTIPTNNEQMVNHIQNMNIPSVENNSVNNSISVATPQIPSFEVPKLETPTGGVQNNNPINFTGNLFDMQPQVSNLMQTTDNFNSMPNTMPNTEVPVSGTPFFGPHITVENNPIPVAGPINNMPINQPSMFGQLEQNRI